MFYPPWLPRRKIISFLTGYTEVELKPVILVPSLIFRITFTNIEKSVAWHRAGSGSERGQVVERRGKGSKVFIKEIIK